MRAARRVLVLAIVTAAACGGSARYRTQLVGSGHGVVAPRGREGAWTEAVAAPGAGGIQLPQGTYEVAMRFDVPRAQRVDWRIACPGVDVAGDAGETFDDYRARRLAELRAARARDRERVATTTSIVVGAFAPRAEVSAQAGAATVRAEAHVDAGAVGAAVARGAVDDRVALPAGDVGRGSVAARAHVVTGGDGVCMLHVLADDADVRASFQVTRIDDLHEERRMRARAATSVAVEARTRLSAQLVAHGADASIRARRRAAAATARAQVELDAQLAAEAAGRLAAQREERALAARAELLHFLAGRCGARPGHRDEVALQEQQRREQALVADALLAERRDQAALRARAAIRVRLIAMGAKARPPRPAPLPETPGAPPFEDARWIEGAWAWSGVAWEWTAGGWTDPDLFTDAGGADALVGVGVGITVGAGVRDHRPRIVDHRDADAPRVRDHRDAAPPRVRDHREAEHRAEPAGGWTSRQEPTAKIRDHRDDDDDDDDKPRVRDHRR